MVRSLLMMFVIFISLIATHNAQQYCCGEPYGAAEVCCGCQVHKSNVRFVCCGNQWLEKRECCRGGIPC